MKCQTSIGRRHFPAMMLFVDDRIDGGLMKEEMDKIDARIGENEKCWNCQQSVRPTIVRDAAVELRIAAHFEQPNRHV